MPRTGNESVEQMAILAAPDSSAADTRRTSAKGGRADSSAAEVDCELNTVNSSRIACRADCRVTFDLGARETRYERRCRSRLPAPLRGCVPLRPAANA